jgi:hypothetical protein
MFCLQLQGFWLRRHQGHIAQDRKHHLWRGGRDLPAIVPRERLLLSL